MKNIKYIKKSHLYLQILSLSFLYFAFGKLSILFLHGNYIVNIGVFAAEGISLGFVLYFGKKVWPGIFIGQLILALSNDITLIASLSISAINTVEALVGFIILRKLKLNIELKTFRDVFILFIVILLIQFVSALPSNMVLVFSNFIDSANYLSSSFSWWFGNIMGQLLFTPFILIFFREYAKLDKLSYLIYSMIFVIFIYVLEIVLDMQNTLLMLSFSIPIVVFLVSKKGILYGVSLNVLVAIVSSYAIYKGSGPFSLDDVANNAINYNLFILAHILSVFITGILFEDRKRYEKSLHDIIHVEVDKNKEQQLLMLQQSRLAQMGEMISMIAHQWRQPLNNLSLVNQLLVSKYTKEKLDDKAMEYFKVNSKKQIDLMSNTIDDFRDFFNDEKEKKKFKISDSVQNILDMTKVIYKNRGVNINVNIEDEYIVEGFKNALSQAILNIINNAKDALVELNVENKQININIYKDTKKDKIVISISDNAGGIPEDIIDKIFDPYFSTKKEKNGTGLGLYMSKMIINEKMNASIKVFNDTDGAIFKIYLNYEEGEYVE